MTTEILSPQRDDPRELSPLWIVGFVAVSLGAHAIGFSFMSSTHLEAKKPEHVDMEIIEKPKPPPPPVVVKPEPPKPIEAPKPLPKVKLPPPPKNAPPPPPKAEPPPPSAPPPPKAAPTPINIGLSLSSTTQSGGFAAPVGNTLYGKPAEKAADPNASHAYAAPPAAKFVPSYQVTEAPEAVSGEDMRGFYPEEARKDGIETQVIVQITIDVDGHVSKAKVLKPVGHGFDEAAVKGCLTKLRFKPAKLNGQAVATEITWTVTFLLD